MINVSAVFNILLYKSIKFGTQNCNFLWFVWMWNSICHTEGSAYIDYILE